MYHNITPKFNKHLQFGNKRATKKKKAISQYSNKRKN